MEFMIKRELVWMGNTIYHLYSKLHIRLIEMKRKVGKDDAGYKEDLKSKIIE